jgi:hypothetical protein
MYEGESVNRSQLDMKCITCDIQTWQKHLFLTYPHQHQYTCPIALPVCQNQQHRSLLTVVSATSAPGQASSTTFEHP